jgi:hypothetical protein
VDSDGYNYEDPCVPVNSVADPDPGSGAFLPPRSGMNIPDQISESLETVFWVQILKFFDVDPGSLME